MTDASKGDKVFVRVPASQNNGDGVALGFVTKVVEREVDGNDGPETETTLNVRALLDTGADLRLTNVQLVDSEGDVEEDEDAQYDVPKAAWLAGN